MVVTSKYIGCRVTGLYIGVDNVQRYFPQRVTEIELQLDHLRIECKLSPDFWRDQPEIRDPRLCIWLESKRLNGRGRQATVPLSMIPSGENSFILGPAALHSPVTRVRRQPASPTALHPAFGPQPVGDAAA